MTATEHTKCEASWPGFCIFITTVCEGAVPSARDERGLACVFKTEIEAQREIADFVMTRLREFIDGHRDFEDAMTVEEYIVPVDVYPDGSVVDEAGNRFGNESCRAGLSRVGSEAAWGA